MNLVGDVRDALEMRSFFQTKLLVSDADLQWMEWDAVVGKLIRLQVRRMSLVLLHSFTP